MSDLLAIFGPADSDADLVAQIATYRPNRVVVLLEDAETDWAHDDSLAAEAFRSRLAELLSAIESRTGATVVGLAGDRAQLAHWRFDRELAAPVPVAA